MFIYNFIFIFIIRINNTYFFNWKSNSCRFDCFCYILTYKLIDISEKIINSNGNIKDSIQEEFIKKAIKEAFKIWIKVEKNNTT